MSGAHCMIKVIQKKFAFSVECDESKLSEAHKTPTIKGTDHIVKQTHATGVKGGKTPVNWLHLFVLTSDWLEVSEPSLFFSQSSERGIKVTGPTNKITFGSLS